VLTIALVVSLGISGLLGFLGLHRALLSTRDAYYQEYAYAHVQLSLRRAPRSALEGLRDLPGIEVLEGRISQKISVELPGETRRLSGKLLSLPEFSPPRVNRLKLLEGRLPRPGGTPEVVVIEDLARERGLHPGSTLRLVVSQQVQEVTVCGVAMSPEFVYVLPGDGFLPDPKNFGIFWIRAQLAEQLTGMSGAFNDLLVRVGRDSNARAMTNLLDRLLTRYGVLIANERKNMTPYALLDNEIRLTLVRALTVPSIFLFASTLVLNLVLSRLVATQRTQIGTMKALGLSNSRVLSHYVTFALVIALLGSLGGIWGGYKLLGGLLSVYRRFYHLPLGPPTLYPDLILGGTLAAVLGALAGIYRTCLGILAMTPAEAMRPPPPETLSSGLVPHLRGLPFLWRFALRNMLRHPFRTLVSCLGVSLGIALMMTSRFFMEGITEMNMFRFKVVQRQDIELNLEEGISTRSLDEVARLPGVEAVEAAFHHPFEISSGSGVLRRVVAEGIAAGSWMRRPRTLEGHPIPLPKEGILLGEYLAETLGIHPGDQVRMRSLAGRRRTYEVRVAGVYPTYLGRNLAADQAWLRRLVGEPHAVSMLSLSVHGQAKALERALARHPGVLKVTLRREKIQAFEENVQGVLEIATTILLFLAASIACGMLLNATLVGLAERRTELAVLRVQGFRLGEVGDLLLYEHALTGLVGMLLGIPLGFGLITWVHSFLDTEVLRLPFVVTRGNITRALLWAGAFSIFSHMVIRWVLKQERWQENLAVKE
jgi:putative ABC transport system permease protein